MSAPAATERLTVALAGRYRIERELGAGGMATVYLAEDLKHDRKVAIKVLKPELAAVLGAERFVVEIKTTAALQHPHILPLFDSGTADGFLFYVMPYIQGETLRDKLNRETQLGVSEAVRIAHDVADALDYAHRHGVVHRDIKPENILLHDGRPMVADFGIALAVSAAAGGRMTETGLSLGTPHYMSPEQATAEKEITARSDVYSLASVLYEMLTGEPPHMGNSAQQIIMKIITDTPRPVTELRKSVPPHVADAVAHALEKLPADRFATARDFAAALVDESSRSAAHSRTGRIVTPRERARNAVPWGIAAVAIGVASFLAWRANTPPLQPELRLAIPTHGAQPGELEQSIAISPDGRTVAYVGSSGGINRLYRRALNSVEPQVIPGTDGAGEVVFSPDGRSLLFATADRQVKKVPVEGGTVVSVSKTNAPIGFSWSKRFGPVFGMIAFSRTIHGLTTVGTSGDTSLRAITEPATGMDHLPVVLEDGSTTLFTHFGGGRGGQLGVVSLSGGAPEVLDFDLERVVGVADGVLLFVDRGGNLMAVEFDVRRRRTAGQPARVANISGAIADAALSPNGTLALLLKPAAYQVVIVDERGEGQPIISDTVTMFIPRFSPDGRRVAFKADLRQEPTAWLLDVTTHALSKLQQTARPVIAWSADGRKVLTDSGQQLIWKGIESGEPTEKFAALRAGAIFSASVAPDGRAIALGIGFGARGWDVLVRPLTGDSAIVPFAATDANERAPRFSPDGRWIAYASDESGRFEVYVQPYPGPGARVQVSDGGGDSPTWSRDGKRLFYRNARTMMAVELAGGNSLAVSKREHLFDGDYLIDDFAGVVMYDVSPDGHHFVMARAVNGGGAELQVWTGWLPELKRRLAAGK